MPTTRHLLRNTRPIDFPGRDGAQTLDIEIEDGTITRCGTDLQPHDTHGTIIHDCAGAYLSPAWVDMHTHVYWGGSDIGVRPERIGVATGAPILVDAGSAGEGHFLGLREFIIKPARERIIPFLNVGSIGLVATNRVPEVQRLQDIDIARTTATVEQHRPLIAGLKLRLCSIIQPETDILPLKLAKKLSRTLRLPLMVHIGRPLPLVEEVLERLDAGDIVTHIFQGKPASSVVDDAPALAALDAAKRRGVVFDIGHGGASFSYRVARQCIDRGILPDTAGSDLHTGCIDGPVWDLSLVLSKLLSLGMGLADTAAAVGSAPRRALGLPAAALDAGAPAEFTLFTVGESDRADAPAIPDALGDTLPLAKRVSPEATFWKGEFSAASTRAFTRGATR